MIRRIAQIVSAIALVGTVAPAVLYVGGGLPLAPMKAWMLVATVVWFVATPAWMGRKATGRPPTTPPG
jgi:hypothetical protein